MNGTLGTPSTKVVVLIASDVSVCGLAGLFHVDWLVPGYQADSCGPGGALVFQLRQSQSTGDYIVRTSYIARTFDQLRNLAPLTLDAPPAIARCSSPIVVLPMQRSLSARKIRRTGKASHRPAVGGPNELRHGTAKRRRV